jgi:hypothetical protein
MVLLFEILFFGLELGDFLLAFTDAFQELSVIFLSLDKSVNKLICSFY